ncbi:hypothetical protein [Mongoliibacter ruber]|nr:hypothetical protein [Mongoliibacter ruber]
MSGLEAIGQGFGVRLSPNYRVGGNVKTPSGIVMPMEDFSFQTSLHYKFENGLMLDATYIGGPTSIKYKPLKWEPWENLGEAQVRSFMMGVFYERNDNDPAVMPYGGVRLGNFAVNSLNPDFESFNKFAFSIEGGIKIPFSPHFGFFTHVNVLAPIQFGEGEIFRNRTGEYDFTASPGLILFQFNLAYGIYFQLY